MKVLITGVAGFIGSSLADRLIMFKNRVIGIDDFSPTYKPEIKRRYIEGATKSEYFKLYEADICNRDAIYEIFEQESPEVVVHLAARAGVRPSLQNPEEYYRVNIIGSQNILDACRDFQPSHLVFASSSSVYGGSKAIPYSEVDPVMFPISPYAVTKRTNELQAHVYSSVYGVNVTMLRFFTVYGPRQRPDMGIHKFTKQILHGEPVILFGDGSSARDYTYIDDILDGLIKSIERPFRYEIFNLGESRTTKLIDLIEIISEAVGKPVEINWQPRQPGDVEITFADITHARTLLDYRPCIPIEEGIRRYVRWFKTFYEIG
ncbi:MAG TPA: GDP-mannose 4,6-dehydratase [Candidatus Hydrogenedens sp.]|nr:GDP-mannose 4,6-dehydratase [Candidatus Hydrogenedens sp.]HOK09383.1 GDP-mannose 4,6-dehydratase [Candidatus Hydrogenedens sp.]HOL19096.1 GDP-mannose 4,6-dehydratase [Candidatus Hydrogenedens sp.]HPP58086.1 GDP-mannose 4,6-dehydratase [Candidatus Hydrogenedens sp.]